MFLPRKLQKRRRQTSQPATLASGQTIKADAETCPSPALPQGQVDGQVQPASPSASVHDHDDRSSATSSQAPTAPAERTAPPAVEPSAEAAKLERLGEFLFLRLSPLWLALSALEERDRPGSQVCSELIANIKSTSTTAQNDSTDEVLASGKQQGATIHLARLLNLVPGLATRCKSISLLSDALEALQSGPAAGWFVLHKPQFQLQWSNTYTDLARVLHRAVSPHPQPESLAAALAPRLVYIESIPPRIRSRSHAATYLVHLTRSLDTTEDGAAVLTVLEPGLVDQSLTGSSTPAASTLEERWISGRGFFLLDSPERVETLCRTYEWDLAGRLDTQKREPIRCLSWTDWTEMKTLYLGQQQRARSERSASRKRTLEAVDEASDNAQHSIRNRSPPTGTALDNDDWWRGTILRLPLALLADATLTLPAYNSLSELTPASLNRHLKPQLERHVPESIAYIHLDTAERQAVTIRTSHRRLAMRLLAHFAELEAMSEPDERTYWSALPAKVRAAAQKRILTLDAT